MFTKIKCHLSFSNLETVYMAARFYNNVFLPVWSKETLGLVAFPFRQPC